MKELNTRINSLHKVPNFKINDEVDLTPAKVMELIVTHAQFKTRYSLLMDYYKGKHAIQNRTIAKEKPNNKLIDNFSEYITNVKTGYLIGNPVSYNLEDKTAMDEIQTILDYNDEQDINSEVLKLASIFGHAFELHWIDENNIMRFRQMSPENLFIIYGNDIEESIIAAVRYYDVIDAEGEKVTHAELYLKDRVVFLKSTGETMIITDEKAHPYGDVPIVEIKNNEDKIGDFENVITLIDAYELVLSDSVNETQYFSDAYLVIRNLMMTDDNDLADMKNNKIISLDENGEANWLTKNINDGHIQNVLNRLQKDIHRASNTPNLTDEEFGGNLSGVAIRFKLWGLEQDTINKERKFKKALQRRFELISNVMNGLKNKNLVWTDIRITFTRNIPTNALEMVDIVTKLNGVLSQETLLSLLPFVDNASLEMELLAQEEQKNQDDFGFKTE